MRQNIEKARAQLEAVIEHGQHYPDLVEQAKQMLEVGYDSRKELKPFKHD
jgi:hypothetical protein